MPQALMDRIAREVMNERNLAVIDEVAAEDFVEHDPPPGQGPGREGFKRFLAEELFVGFPDLRGEIEEQIAGVRSWSAVLPGTAPTRVRSWVCPPRANGWRSRAW